MSKLSISLWFTILVICSFCKKDFVSLGRHSWRCRGRRTQQQSSESDTRNFGNDQDSNFERSNLQLNHRHNKALLLTFIMCIADVEKCKGLRVLKTHQRTCRFVMGLNEELILGAPNGLFCKIAVLQWVFCWEN